MSPGKLALRSLLSTIARLVGYGALLFVPAGTIYYWQAWAYLVVFIAATITLVIYFGVKDPELLERRLTLGPTQEPRPVQRVLMSVFMLNLDLRPS